MASDGRAGLLSDGRIIQGSDGRWSRVRPLLPTDVVNLRSWHDAYDSATYDGSNWLTSITDKGPDGHVLVPRLAAGMGGTTFAVGLDAGAFLPGNAAATNPDSHPEKTVAMAITDFTVMAIIPTEYAPSTGRAYYCWRTLIGEGGGFGFILQASGTPGNIDIAGPTATVVGTIATGIADANGATAAAIVFVTRAGGRLTADCWYDKKTGGAGAVVRAPSLDVADPLLATLNVTKIAAGGRSSISQPWGGSVKAKYHSVAWWDRPLTAAEKLGLAQGAGVRCNIVGIV